VFSYRLLFPPDPDTAIENTATVRIESETVYRVGDEIDHDGKRWRVSKAPLEDPEGGSVADLMVWPAD
jgi:hypothetical protein